MKTNEAVEAGYSTLWRDYENGLSYQSSSGMAKNIPQFVNFYEGRQWAAPTKNTKNMPRPVINIIKMICRNKRSAILSTPVRIVYKSDNPTANVEKFNDFADYIQKEYGQDMLDKRAIDDSVKKGSYFYHYYWDSEAVGKEGNREGGLRCEIIDPLNIFFADPTETDEQKQKWILIASREEVSSVREKCDNDVDPELIVPDEERSGNYGKTEQEGSSLVTVLTRYFRKNGEVYCEKGTRNTIINRAFPISPDVEAAGRELGFDSEDGSGASRAGREDAEGGIPADAPNNSLPDDAGREEKPLMSGRNRAYLYPVVVGNYEKREKSIYGLGEVEGLIPNQKAINFNIAMSLLNTQEIAWGKYVVLPGALGSQAISNEPGQVLTDYSGTGNGIKKMTEQTIQSAPMALVESILSMTRSVTGSTEIMTGETIGANMSGAAIAQLQSTAQQPIEELRETFFLVKEKQGRVLAQFFKQFYAEKEFTYTSEEPVISEDGTVPMDQNGVPVKQETLHTGVFNSSEYRDTEFSVVVETTSGTKSSTAGDINLLDTLFAKGAIGLKTYISCYPKDAVSNREELLRMVTEEEQAGVRQMQEQLAEAAQTIQGLQSQIQADARQIEEQKATVDRVVSLINENASLKAYIARLYTEASAKIAASNREIAMGNKKIEETTRDATSLASMVASNMANGGNTVAGVNPGTVNAGTGTVSGGMTPSGNGQTIR